jgi:hypothetical protein
MVGCKKEDLNKVPVADAGPSRSITAPTDTLTLSGTGTDADGKVVAYAWEQVSGPAATTIVNPGSPSTLVTGLVAGSYVFQLAVTDDGGATGVDTTTVVVSAAEQTTLTLHPPIEYALGIVNGADATGPTDISVETDAWTINSIPTYVRAVMKFDLSAIPANATITSANLYLYSNPTPGTGNFIDANYGASNSFTVQQITSSWSTSTLGWFNQPAVSTTNQVVVPQTSQSKLDLNLDVTAMVASMVSTNTNYGFLMRLENEVIYDSRIFVSSHNSAYPDKHPKLVVIFH